MRFTELAYPIFEQAIADYHVHDNIDQPVKNPYEAGRIEHDLYMKNWIDTVQWHFEDIIRDPQIDPAEALVLKRRIDKSNQDRTDLVETIDSWFWTIDQLIEDIEAGRKYMKVYKQMKMYNDPDTNPVLYKK